MTRFPYLTIGAPSRPMPRMPFPLRRGTQTIDVYGLVDSGASVNLIPFSVGVALGAHWQDQRILEPISGALGRLDTRGLFVTFKQFDLMGGSSVELAFAWASRDNVPVILGQENFFDIFDVCFFRAEDSFEVTRR